MSDFKGIWIPAEVWLMDDFLLLEKVFFCKIYGLCNDSGCFASNKFFADFFGVSKSRCTQIIKKLEEHKYISVTLERKGKLVSRRVVNVLNKGSKLFKHGGESVKHGGKEIKQGCLIDSEYKNTEDKNKIEELKESKDTLPISEFPNLEIMQQILKGELVQKTALDKNFNFGLFPDNWSNNFKNEILGYFRYMEQKKGDRWGILGTISSQLSVLKSYCNEFSESEIIAAFQETINKGNVSYNPKWTKNRNEEKPIIRKNDNGSPSYMLGVER